MRHVTRTSRRSSTDDDQDRQPQRQRWFRDIYRDAIWDAEDLTATEKAIAETYARLMIPSGSSDGGTTNPDVGSSDGGTTVVPLSTRGSSTLSNLPHPRSSDGGTPPLLRPQGLTPTSLPTRLPARGDGRPGREEGNSDQGPQWRSATDLVSRHAPELIGTERTRLTAAVCGALNRGWPAAAVAKELSRDTAGADSLIAVLLGRMKNLGNPTKTRLSAADDPSRREDIFAVLRVTVIDQPECPHGFRGGNIALDRMTTCYRCRKESDPATWRDIREIPAVLSRVLKKFEQRGLDSEAEDLLSSLTDDQLDALPDVQLPGR